MSADRFTKAELAAMAHDLVALEREAKGVRTGRFKWEHYPIPAKPSEVRRTRRSLGFTREAFAKLVGISPITVKAWEIGQRTPEGPASKLIRLLMKDKKLAAALAKV